MEQLLEDIQPPRDKVFDDLDARIARGPGLSGADGHGDARQRRAAADEGAAPRVARHRRNRQAPGREGRQATRSPMCSRRMHTTHGGKMSIVRMLAGQAGDGTTFDRRRRRSRPRRRRVQACRARPPRSAGRRRSARPSPSPSSTRPRPATRSPPASTPHPPLAKVEPYPPVLAIAISAKERKDDVKLGQALNKLVEEDPSITIVHNPGDARGRAVGPGRDASARRDRAARRPLRRRASSAASRSVGYRETIRKGDRRSAAATRSSPAATASSATSCSTSSRCRAARASPSRTRSPAAWCRATTSPRSRKA